MNSSAKPIELYRAIACTTFITLVVFLFSSCTVTNSIYLTEADPYDTTELYVFGGVSSGVVARKDSVSVDGVYHFSDRYMVLPSLVLGGTGRLTDQMNIRFSIHGAWGSLGTELSTQYSLFKKHTLFNCAIGAQFGISKAFDSTFLFSSKENRFPHTQHFMHGDIYVPLGLELSDKVSLNITPRISYSQFQLNRYNDYSDKYNVRPVSRVLTMSLRFKRPDGYLYFEASATHIADQYIPTVGFVWMERQ